MSAPYLFVRGLSYFCGIGQSKEYTAEPQLLKLIKNDIINKTEDWFEYFSERKTKFYLDWDKNVDHPVKNCHIIESYKECLVKINEIVRYVKSIYNLDVSFKTATRTGDGYYVKEKKDKSLESGYKISLRFYFNFSIKYTEIPDFLRKLKQDEFWDIKPYNKKNQKLNLIGCVKSNKDERILLPFDGKKIMKKYDPEEYIVK